MNLSKNVDLALVKGQQSAGTTEVESDSVDVANYDGVLFFAKVAAADAGNHIVIEQSADDATWAELTGTKVIVEEANQVVAVDVFRPLEGQGRYLRAKVVRGSSTATGDVYAARYSGRTRPEDFGALLAISPATSG